MDQTSAENSPSCMCTPKNDPSYEGCMCRLCGVGLCVGRPQRYKSDSESWVLATGGKWDSVGENSSRKTINCHGDSKEVSRYRNLISTLNSCINHWRHRSAGCLSCLHCVRNDSISFKTSLNLSPEGPKNKVCLCVCVCERKKKRKTVGVEDGDCCLMRERESVVRTYKVPQGNMNVRDRQTHRWQAGLLCWTPPKKDRDTKRAHCRERAGANIKTKGCWIHDLLSTLFAFKVDSSYLYAEKKGAHGCLPSGTHVQYATHTEDMTVIVGALSLG